MLIATAPGEFDGDDKIERVRGTILRLGTKRFGSANVATKDAVMSITDSNRLERMMEAVLDARSWQEMLEVA